MFYKWFGVVSIVSLPTCFVLIVSMYSIDNAKLLYYYFQSEYLVVDVFFEKVVRLFKTIQYLALTTNLISCMVLAMVMRLIYKMTQSAKVGTNTTA